MLLETVPEARRGHGGVTLVGDTPACCFVLRPASPARAPYAGQDDGVPSPRPDPRRVIRPIGSS